MLEIPKNPELVEKTFEVEGETAESLEAFVEYAQESSEHANASLCARAIMEKMLAGARFSEFQEWRRATDEPEVEMASGDDKGETEHEPTDEPVESAPKKKGEPEKIVASPETKKAEEEAEKTGSISVTEARRESEKKREAEKGAGRTGTRKIERGPKG